MYVQRTECFKLPAGENGLKCVWGALSESRQNLGHIIQGNHIGTVFKRNCLIRRYALKNMDLNKTEESLIYRFLSLKRRPSMASIMRLVNCRLEELALPKVSYRRLVRVIRSFEQELQPRLGVRKGQKL
jgi:hypothetical protein